MPTDLTRDIRSFLQFSLTNGQSFVNVKHPMIGACGSRPQPERDSAAPNPTASNKSR